VEGGASIQLDRSRELAGDKATRIVEAMRSSVARRGIAGSTFDHVAREAGVSRGLLHYYFGTKERLLVEVVRRETDVRIEQLELQIASATSAEDVLAALVDSFEEFLREPPAEVAIFYELMTLAQRNDDIASELGELGRRTRLHLAQALRSANDAGILQLSADADVVATFLFALADGVAVRRLSEPQLDIAPTVALVVSVGRSVLT
jgi:AcrR family transcriptional regulator